MLDRLHKVSAMHDFFMNESERSVSSTINDHFSSNQQQQQRALFWSFINGEKTARCLLRSCLPLMNEGKFDETSPWTSRPSPTFLTELAHLDTL